jgi:hypothetical protein
MMVGAIEAISCAIMYKLSIHDTGRAAGLQFIMTKTD